MNATSVDYEMSPKQDGSDNDPNSPGQTLEFHTKKLKISSFLYDLGLSSTSSRKRKLSSCSSFDSCVQVDLTLKIMNDEQLKTLLKGQ